MGKVKEQLIELLEDERLAKLFQGHTMVIAWDCDECGTVMDDGVQACTNCGYTYKQKCERWPD